MKTRIQTISGQVEIIKGRIPQNRLLQYAGAFSACLGAFSIGNTLGWSSPTSSHLRNGEMGFPINDTDISWIGSLMNVGAAVSCIPTGYFTDRYGRKATLLSLVPMFLLGWSLILWAQSVEMLCAGRLISGMCAGSMCVAAPTFTAEICEKEIRGALGTYYQLILTFGVLFSYVVGPFMTVFWFSFVCAVVPILFGIALMFFPDTPIYYIIKNDIEKARSSLRFFRAPDYDIDKELDEYVQAAAKDKLTKQSLWKLFTTRQALISVYISVGMMAVQQFTGIKIVLFYTTDIFKDAGTAIPPQYATMITGSIYAVATLLSMFVVDRVGRKVLLIMSATMITVANTALGVYFHLKNSGYDTTPLWWLPVASLCLFMAMFSIGYGPVPWVVMPEVLPNEIRGTASSIAGTVNWLSGFIVSKCFINLVSLVGVDFTFWMLAGAAFIGVVFSVFLPETKGMAFEDIQEMLKTGRKKELIESKVITRL